VWVSLAIMLAEAVSSLLTLVILGIIKHLNKKYPKIEISENSSENEEADPAPVSQQVPHYWWVIGLTLSCILCWILTWAIFVGYKVPLLEPLAALALSLFVSILAVRALGETDVNPVSGVGKISQLAFAAISPGNILSNLVAGAIAEAGAQQAGDMMQDLKTGHLMGASPRAQFYAQLIGSGASAFFAVAAFLLYTSAYPLGGPDFPVPTAPIWLNMARFVNGGKLATNVEWFCVVGGIFGIFLAVFSQVFPQRSKFLPSGVAFAIAMYVTPNFTIPRVIGALVNYIWAKKFPQNHSQYMFVVASGFVLGEGLTSIVTALLKNPLKVPAWSCAGCVPGFCSC